MYDSMKTMEMTFGCKIPLLIFQCDHMNVRTRPDGASRATRVFLIVFSRPSVARGRPSGGFKGSQTDDFSKVCFELHSFSFS